MSTFNLFNDRVDIMLSDGEIVTLYFNQNSGRAYYRNKLPAIKHPGIYIGSDQNGIEYFAHNHPFQGKPTLVPGIDFSDGANIFLYPEFATNPPLKVIEIALNRILSAEKYTLMTFNCQDFVNEALISKRKSPAVNNSFGGIFAILLAGLLLSFASSSK